MELSFPEKKDAVPVGVSNDAEVCASAACTQSKCDSAELEPQPQRSPTKNDFGSGSAAHQKIEADVPGYIAVTQTHSNKLFGHTNADIERHSKE